MQLNRENYRSPEAEAEYMSVSQWGGWLTCPAKQLAIMRGEYVEPSSPAQIIGSYVDMALLTPKGLGDWISQNAGELLCAPTKETIEAKIGKLVKGQTVAAALEGNPELRLLGAKKAPAQTADACIERAQRDPVFWSYVGNGEHQVIVTGTIAGTPWKGLVDTYCPSERRIVDLKCLQALSGLFWLERRTIFNVLDDREGKGSYTKYEKGPWYEAWGYWKQAAVYRELERQMRGPDAAPWDFFLAPISKQDPPDLDVYFMADENRLAGELREIEIAMPRVLAWKTGAEPAPHCWGETDGDCAYCRGKKLARIVEAKSYWTAKGV